MNRRAFIFAGAAATVAVTLPFPTVAPPIGRILDRNVHQPEWPEEYFFAHSQAQEDELYEAARMAAAEDQPFYFWNDGDGCSHGRKGIVAFAHHGGGCASVPLVNFCCVVLLPETIGHPAFEKIRRKAELW